MQQEPGSSYRYPLTLLAIYGVAWLALAFKPVFRDDWLLENLLVFIAVPLLVFTARRLRFSNFAYGCLFVFFLFHAIGSHYTYALVPYDEWYRMLTGITLEGRNHYDRLVHFLYGLLVAPAAVEIFAHYGRYPRSWAFLFPWLFMAAHSAIYELIEWAAAIVFGGDLGQAYLGTQGDIWDGHKDMALAIAGTTLMLVAIAAAGRLPISRQSASGHPG